jgi:glycine cleavage system H protein
VTATPKDRKYTETHEWFLVEGDMVRIGITQFAADELTDITYVALPAVGKTVEADQSFGEIESVKATSELFTAVGGQVAEVNSALADQPELVNTDPFNKGWMIKLRAKDLKPLDNLMDASAYDQMLSQK